MADEESDEEGFNSEGFDVVRYLPAFLASVLDKTEYICQNESTKELPKRMLK